MKLTGHRETRNLCYFNAALRPVQCRGGKQVDVEGPVIVGVYGVHQFGVRLASR